MLEPEASEKRARRRHPPRLEKGSACRACRERKIKCDGTRPICIGCSSRGRECVYEVEVKRRGPDRTPGNRTRKALAVSSAPILANSMSSTSNQTAPAPVVPSTVISNIYLEADPSTLSTNTPALDPQSSPIAESSQISYHPRSSGSPISSDETATMADIKAEGLIISSGDFHLSDFLSVKEYNRHQVHPWDENGFLEQSDSVSRSLNAVRVSTGDFMMRDGVITWADGPPIILSPSLDFQRKTWWDRLLDIYALDGPDPARLITSDLAFFFRTSVQAISFFHLPSFFSRATMQPAVVLASLAFSTLTQSSSVGKGQKGREKALLLQAAAQGALEASINAQFIEPSLAQAAIVICLFELCPHPMFSLTRFLSSLRMMDAIVQTLNLCVLDVTDPDCSVFPPQIPPTIVTGNARIREGPDGTIIPVVEDTALPCICESLVAKTPETGSVSDWVGSPAWDSSWTEFQTRKEENRRICWSALRLAVSFLNYEAAFTPPDPQARSQFFITQPSNYALLFPGEALFRSRQLASGVQPQKWSVWALNIRSQFLWCSVSSRSAHSSTGTEDAAFAMEVWQEARSIEAALNKHQCRIEEYNYWIGRHYLQDAKMSATYDFVRFVPSPQSGEFSPQQKLARDWVGYFEVFHQQYGKSGLNKITSHTIRRPFIVWFLIQLLARCLKFWEIDKTLVSALELGKKLAPSIRAMLDLFPCPEPEKILQEFKGQLKRACEECGVPI